MKINDPNRNRIPTWSWGNKVEIYLEQKTAPRWIKCRGRQSNPCDVAGCKRFIDAGEFYVLHPGIGIVCRDCAKNFGAYRSEEEFPSPISPGCRKPCPEHVHLGELDCPFISCPMR